MHKRNLGDTAPELPAWLRPACFKWQYFWPTVYHSATTHFRFWTSDASRPPSFTNTCNASLSAIAITETYLPMSTFNPSAHVIRKAAAKKWNCVKASKIAIVLFRLILSACFYGHVFYKSPGAMGNITISSFYNVSWIFLIHAAYDLIIKGHYHFRIFLLLRNFPHISEWI